MMYTGIGKYYNTVKTWKVFAAIIGILWIGNLIGGLTWDTILYFGG
jgi:formate/nitrite transporter FocA (FNT family)